MGSYRRRSRSYAQKRALWQAKAQGAQCQACGATGDLTHDHIVPMSRGGTDHPSNLRLLCRSCNSRKGTRHGIPPRGTPPPRARRMRRR